MNTITLTQTETWEIQSEGAYIVDVQMIINDGVEDVVIKELYFEYNTNTSTLEEATSVFLQKVKSYWDKYQRIIADPKLDYVPTAISEVRELVETYINE